MPGLTGMFEQGVSVVICCYNSKARIVPTLQHLAAQKGMQAPWEVVIVDNNSSDGTGELVADVWEKFSGPVPLRVIRESRPGTMYARRKGIEEAAFRYLLYCDDDNWLMPDYVNRAFDIISADDTIAALGGQGIVEAEQSTKVPEWIGDFSRYLGAGPQGKHDGDTTHDKGCLYTAGTILDRVWLDKLYNEYGFVSTMKGRDGRSLMAGEDTELTYALRLIGGRLYYSSDLRFRHYMPSGRLRWKYLRNLNTSMGRSDFLLYPYTEFFRDGKTNQPVWKLVAVRFIFLMRAAFNALASAFRAGSPAVLRYERAKGEIVAILFNMEQMKRSRAWIIQASEQLQRK